MPGIMPSIIGGGGVGGPGPGSLFAGQPFMAAAAALFGPGVLNMHPSQVCAFLCLRNVSYEWHPQRLRCLG
jgi:hypothetical protein